MSVARPARRLLGQCLSSSRTAPSIIVPGAASATAACPSSTSQFHTSAPRSKRKSRFHNVTAEKLGLTSNPAKLEQYQREKFPEFSPEQTELLKNTYSPEQLEALQAGEAAIDPKDLILQGRLRDDPFKPDYIEDYATLDPRYDVKPEVEGRPVEVKWPDSNALADKMGLKQTKIMEQRTTEALTRAMVRALRRVKESKGEELIDLTEAELEDLEKDPELLQRYLVDEDAKVPRNAEAKDFLTTEQAKMLDEAVDNEWRAELKQLAALPPDSQALVEDDPLDLAPGVLGDGAVPPSSAHAVELGKIPGVAGLYRVTVDPEDEGQDDAGKYQNIKRLTGMKLKEIRTLVTKGLVTRWVSNQTRLGKVRSTSVVAIAGNGNGRLGLGMAKSTQPGVAEETAQMLAIRNMKPIRRYENRTIYGNVNAKVSGTVVELFARPPGFGLRVPHRIFEMCRAAGIHDLSARIPRSKNPMNSVKAAYEALTSQPDPEQIAIGRGKKLVDVRKVYYGGAVY